MIKFVGQCSGYLIVNIDQILVHCFSRQLWTCNCRFEITDSLKNNCWYQLRFWSLVCMYSKIPLELGKNKQYKALITSSPFLKSIKKAPWLTNLVKRNNLKVWSYEIGIPRRVVDHVLVFSCYISTFFFPRKLQSAWLEDFRQQW